MSKPAKPIKEVEDNLVEETDVKPSETGSSIDENYELSSFEKEYRRVRALFDQGWDNSSKYIECAEECQNLLKRLIINIIDKNHRKLSRNKSYRPKFDDIHGDPDKNINLEDQELRKICELIDDPSVNYFKLAGENYETHSPLLKSYKFAEVAGLIDYCLLPNTSDIGRKLAVQQILNAITALLLARRKDLQIQPFHLLANYEHLRLEAHRIELNHRNINDDKSVMDYVFVDREEKSETRVFQYLKLRGMLINTSDKSRNIAFKVETFNNILSTIFHGVEDVLKTVVSDDFKKENSGKKAQEVIAQMPKNIILNAGYLSGLSFGWTMHEIIQQENERLDLIEKIEKWCDFDSDVGFGKLELIKDNIPADFEESPEKTFEIKLSDNFVVYKRGNDDVNLCSFIAGYIQGVLEKVVQLPLKIKHKPKLNHCEQFQPGQNYCIFLIETDMEKMKSIKSEVNEKYKYELTPNPVFQERIK
ncbi:MAG: hypothetical protein R8G66_04765 [Cytophagales bacterium]|nr:hypothetical protein [Cytophagales bacterium]